MSNPAFLSCPIIIRFFFLSDGSGSTSSGSQHGTLSLNIYTYAESVQGHPGGTRHELEHIYTYTESVQGHPGGTGHELQQSALHLVREARNNPRERSRIQDSFWYRMCKKS